MRGLEASKILVTNPADKLYAAFPNPPLGLVFLNYSMGDGSIPTAKVLLPGMAWFAVALCKYGSATAIDRAKLIADCIIDNLIETVVDGLSYTLPACPYWSEADNQWKQPKNDDYVESYIRDLFLCVFALLWVYKKTSIEPYRTNAIKLIETAWKIQEAFIAIAGEGLTYPAYMQGAYPEFMLRTAIADPFVPSYYRSPLHLADIVYDVAQLAIELFNDAQVTSESAPYLLSDLNGRHYDYMMANLIDSTRGKMSAGLPYMFMGTAGQPGPEYAPVGMNLHPIDLVWGDTDWTSDTVFWGTLGMVKNDSVANAAFVNAVKAIKVNNYFYDIYKFDGTTDPVYPDIATQATIFYIEMCRIINNPDTVVEQALINLQVTSSDLNADGLYKWAVE